MTELATTQPAPGALALRSDQQYWTDQQRAALAQIGLTAAPAADLAVFMHVAQRTGLDPFSRQIYMISRWDSQSGGNKFTIQTGIDGLRIIADRRPEFAGQLGPEWCGEDGVWRDFWPHQTPPLAARVGVIRRDFDQPVWGIAMFAEYAQTKKGGALTSMWAGKPALMIAKCAEALALRKAFPHDLAGLITPEEADRDDMPTGQRRAPAAPVTVDELTGTAPNPEPPADRWTDEEWDDAIRDAVRFRDVEQLRTMWREAKEQRPDDTSLRERIAEASKVAATPIVPVTEDDEPVEAELVDEPVDQKAHRQMHALWRKAGVDDREARLAVTSHLVGRPVASSKDLTAAEVATILGRLTGLDDEQLPEAVDHWLGEYYAAQGGQP